MKLTEEQHEQRKEDADQYNRVRGREGESFREGWFVATIRASSHITELESRVKELETPDMLWDALDGEMQFDMDEPPNEDGITVKLDAAHKLPTEYITAENGEWRDATRDEIATYEASRKAQREKYATDQKYWEANRPQPTARPERTEP